MIEQYKQTFNGNSETHPGQVEPAELDLFPGTGYTTYYWIFALVFAKKQQVSW